MMLNDEKNTTNVYSLIDMIAVLGESTGYFALKRIRRLMQLHPEGQKILR
jgi:hypothetical protein